jgi:7,8-dihydropterin-6-yl-methyl-4-(beta-D-ribofuranosyl)aminobenzene 5'-phosphate synthase
VLVTGEIERTTDFEKGLPHAYLERGGKTEPDRILDDQGLVVHLKGKGLVIITGCAHSGIINTIQFAQKLTEISSVYAIIGGFHLSGPKFESIIPRTLEELKVINPAVICPMHCTGWKATVEIARKMLHQFVLNSVGTTLVL